ncbi:MAG: hypothetical protein IJ022_04915 [Burkholderiaceae bacterium]|nr:hypothetical protein [Burkholderiaceae bacterium]
MFDGSVQDDILMLCRYAKPIQEKEKQKRFERAIQIVNILLKILNQEAITLSSSQVTRVGMARMLSDDSLSS